MANASNELFEVINEKVFNDLKSIEINSEDKIVKEIFELFINSSSQKLERLQEYADTGDLKAYNAEIHSLKSSALTIGALRLAELCDDLVKKNDSEIESTMTIYKIKTEINKIITATDASLGTYEKLL